MSLRACGPPCKAHASAPAPCCAVQPKDVRLWVDKAADGHSFDLLAAGEWGVQGGSKDSLLHPPCSPSLASCQAALQVLFVFARAAPARGQTRRAVPHPGPAGVVLFMSMLLSIGVRESAHVISGECCRCSHMQGVAAACCCLAGSAVAVCQAAAARSYVCMHLTLASSTSPHRQPNPEALLGAR